MAILSSQRLFTKTVPWAVDSAFFSRLTEPGNGPGALLAEASSKEVVEAADRIADGELQVGALPPLRFEKGVEWHRDFLSGHRWPLQPFLRIYDPNDSGHDLNIPFELGRLQFLTPLLQAYTFTGADRYFKTMRRLVFDWIARNPYGFGIHWWSGMEVALRAVNLVVATAGIAASLKPVELRHLLAAIRCHGSYLYRYSVAHPYGGNKNNHYLAEMLGLLAVGFCFEGPMVKQWREAALDGLRREVTRQFHSDGGNFESATGYHQFSLEVILWAVLFIQAHAGVKAGRESAITFFGDEAVRRLECASEMVACYMDCLGESPRFGDSSDGRVILFDRYFDRVAADHTFIMSLCREALGYEPTRAANVCRPFEVSGYGFYRNTEYGFSCFSGPKGSQGTGGHGHNDKGSIVLQVAGEPVIVEAGTYVYNSHTAERFELKRTSAHNVLELDGQEQCVIEQNRVFGLLSPMTAGLSLVEGSQGPGFRMTHDGYARLSSVGLVERTIRPMEHALCIDDRIEGYGSHDILFTLNLVPGSEVVMYDQKACIRVGHVEVAVLPPKGFSSEVGEQWYSASYRVRMKAPQLRFRARIDFPTTFTTEVRVKATS